MLARIRPHAAEPAAPPEYAPVQAAVIGAGVIDVNCDCAFVIPLAPESQSGVHHPLLAPDPTAIATQFDAVVGQPLAPDPALKSHF